MANGIGPRVVHETGDRIGVIATADGEWKYGGIAIDWSVCPVASAELTDVLLDNRAVPAGIRYLPAGTVITKITASGLYGPAHTGADDGRENLERDQTFIVNHDYLETDSQSAEFGVIYGGTVFSDRIRWGQTLAGTPSAIQPSKANVLAVLPRLVTI